MASQNINVGTAANQGDGEPLRNAFIDIRKMFAEVYGQTYTSDTQDLSGATLAIKENQLSVTNSPTDGYVLTYDNSSGGFTWEQKFDGDITSVVAGDGLIGGAADGDATLNVNVDDSTIEIDTDTVRIKDDGVTADKLANDIRGVQYVGIDTGDYIEFTADTQMDFYVNGSNEMRLEADGDLHVDGDVIAASTTVSSDENLKKEIETYKDALKTISELKGVSFAWKSNDKKSGGVIAQDVQKVLPELVGTKKSLNGGEETLTVDYNGLIGVLIEAVKDLSAQINDLKK